MTPDQQKEATVIALFMGYKFEGDGKDTFYKICKPFENDWYYGSLLIEDFEKEFSETIFYHTSFDWLHVAWNKFRRVDLPNFQHDMDYMDWCSKISYAIANEDTPEKAAGLLARGIEYLNNLK